MSHQIPCGNVFCGFFRRTCPFVGLGDAFDVEVLGLHVPAKRWAGQVQPEGAALQPCQDHATGDNRGVAGICSRHWSPSVINENTPPSYYIKSLVFRGKRQCPHQNLSLRRCCIFRTYYGYALWIWGMERGWFQEFRWRGVFLKRLRFWGVKSSISMIGSLLAVRALLDRGHLHRVFHFL